MVFIIVEQGKGNGTLHDKEEETDTSGISPAYEQSGLGDELRSE